LETRELTASHKTTSNVLAAVVLAAIGWEVYSIALAPTFQIPGGALPFILLLEGLLIIATHKNTMVQIIGYLVMENSIVYIGALFSHGFPLLIETMVVLDVLGVVLVGLVLAVQRDVVGIPEHAVLEELTG
jgi:hydrogenase-4 membrane subunit HyfE